MHSVDEYFSFESFCTTVSQWFFTEIWVRASLQDSSQNSDRYQQCCSVNSLHLSSNFQVFQSFYQSFGACTERTDFYYYYSLIKAFLHQRSPIVFLWSLSDSKSPQVSRTLLSILAVLNNVVVWMISTRPPTSKSSSPLSNPLVSVPNAPITIGIFVTCMFHSFFQFPIKVEVLILLFTFFQFYSVVRRDSKVDYFASSLFFFFFDYY